MKNKFWSAVIVVVAAYYVFNDPAGAAAIVKAVIHAVKTFLSVLFK